MSVEQSLSEMIPNSGLDTASVTVAGLREAMSSGRLAAAELTSFYLGRIERLNDALGAVISVSADAAAQATAIDAARSAGAGQGPLAGIPILIKDNISAEGSPATAGSPALEHAEAKDAFIVGKLRAAGAVILGKANLSEWANFRSAHSTSGWSTLGGQAINPHGTGRNPSGSSSGSGVAMAAGLAALTIGTETDGSVISPSNNCGIVGIKPTLGLVSRTGIVPISSAQDTAGPMTRCVADAAVLLGVIAGLDPGDPATEDTPDGRSAPGSIHADYTQFLDPAALTGARIGIWRAGASDAVPGAVEVLDRAVSVLRTHGAVIVDPVELPGAENIGKPEFTALGCEFKDDLNAYLAGLGGEHPMSLEELIEFNSVNNARVLARFGQEIFIQAQQTGGRSDPVWKEARDEARRLARSALNSALAEHSLDAVVTLSGNPAWLTDYVLGDHVTVGTTSPAAVSGYPSLTVPAGYVDGLPVGISFTGPAWSEPKLLALAYAFEQGRSLR
ncbi:MAG TPA: amidase [Streptosporangiaceae bacterium]|nr:amidase [Streptosporangiaceae bacterium]